MRRIVGLVLALSLVAAPVSAAAVHVEGVARLKVAWTNERTWWLSLDTGKTGAYGDLMLMLMCSGEGTDCAWLLAAAGAHLKRWDARPARAACDRTRVWPTGLAEPDTDPDGSWFCARTGEGRPSRFRILHWPTRAERWLGLRYLTWER